MTQRARIATIGALWMALACADGAPRAGDEPSTRFLVTYSGQASAKDIETFEASLDALAPRPAERRQLSRTMYSYAFPGVLTADERLAVRKACGADPIVCECCESGMACTTGTAKRRCP